MNIHGAKVYIHKTRLSRGKFLSLPIFKSTNHTDSECACVVMRSGSDARAPVQIERAKP